VESVFCCITYPDRTGYATMGTSVFDAAANALEWVEAHRREPRRDDDARERRERHRGTGVVRRRREEVAVSIRAYLLGLSRLCIEVARDPRLLPKFLVIIALAPGTITGLAGAKAKRRIAA
jgi:hypothetical protein